MNPLWLYRLIVDCRTKSLFLSFAVWKELYDEMARTETKSIRIKKKHSCLESALLEDLVYDKMYVFMLSEVSKFS